MFGLFYAFHKNVEIVGYLRDCRNAGGGLKLLEAPWEIGEN